MYAALLEMNIGTEAFIDCYPPHPPEFHYHLRVAVELLLAYDTWKVKVASERHKYKPPLFFTWMNLMALTDPSVVT